MITTTDVSNPLRLRRLIPPYGIAKEAQTA
jgi:hypothetical protein